jgi:pyruvate/oxaloacetate carboxyltransferase
MTRNELLSGLYEEGVASVTRNLNRQYIQLSEEEFKEVEDSFKKDLQELCEKLMHELDHFGEKIANNEVMKIVSDPQKIAAFLNTYKKEAK